MSVSILKLDQIDLPAEVVATEAKAMQITKKVFMFLAFLLKSVENTAHPVHRTHTSNDPSFFLLKYFPVPS